MERRLQRTQVLENTTVARDTVILRVDMGLPQLVEPGQFAMVHPLRAGCILPRPFSILDADADSLTILVKVVGKGSRALAALRPGEELRIFAPLGSSFDVSALSERECILVAGGVGLVPLHMLARRLRESAAHPVIPIFGARSEEDLPRSLLRKEDVAWRLWVEKPSKPDCRKGLVTAGLEEAFEEHPDAVVTTCGPTPMMRAVATICRRERRPLWLCLEEQMGCGAGVCRACVVPAAAGDRMRTVCKDGPVFALDDIQFFTTAGSAS
jgi:dihydroorotate dehydrogenase electron transfer subunit